ncbi:hypothetical protein K488DRAFT_85336 [Vararia minispora EC-137]|uniref:Uncharacterized protein n=1 Tax=Vararia minispora EC-137 TaxID=1314806 RepID=A0ACB8QMB0_9AGAM|nr:hypothetical protein K488DRAFT_85336 [Vararia minispora EC-137]
MPGLICDQSCSCYTVYDRTSSSSTSENINKIFSLSYAYSSTVGGEQYVDTVHIAGLATGAQVLGAAETYSTSIETEYFQADEFMSIAWLLTDRVSNTTAIGDTGTTLIIGYPMSVRKAYESITDAKSNGDGTYIVPCNLSPMLSLIFCSESPPVSV